MSETPIKGLSKFHTISMYPQKSNSIGFASTTHRLKDRRKSNSVLANPQSVMTTTIPNIQQNLSLPKIHKRKKQKKQGGFLESWLDEALGAPDPFAIQKPTEDRIQGNVLKTLKKYELDKRHLQSQNIPGQKVQRLYKSLYIYSHGVNKIFEELINLTKQTNNSDLIGNFWRAYTKLLQSCTSYQTVFQKVQKDHLQNIQRLKHNIQVRSQSFEEQRKQLQTKINKLQKVVQQKDVQYNSLKTQYDVLQNTLNLTDEAFNDQVNLRLKFEEKINAVYTSYEELKTKYSKIVEQMGIKKIQFLERDNAEAILKNKLLVETTKVDQLMFLLKAERQKVQQRQTQITIKVQQLEDAKSLLLAKATQQDTTHDKIEQHLIKSKALKTRLIEVQNVVSGQKITIKQQEEHIKKMSNSLEEYKQHNNQIYDKFAVSGKNIVALQSKIEEDGIKIIDLERAKLQKSSQIADLNRELQHVKNQRDTLRHELNIATKNLKDTRDTMTKNNVILQEMKAVKDKYQRINEFLRIQLKQLEDANNRTTQELSIKAEQLQGMKLLLQNRNKSLVQMQKQLQQQKQLTKAKVAGLNTTITKKQNLSLQYQKRKQQLQKQLSDSKILLKIAQDKLIILQSQKIKLQIQLNSKIKILKQLEQVLDKENIKFKELNSKLEVQLKQKSDISNKLVSTSFVLKVKNQEERVEVASLGALLAEYKRKIVERAQYVHPMLYEEVCEIARRCALNEQRQKKQAAKKTKQSQLLSQKNKKLQSQIKDHKHTIQSLQSKSQKLTQQKIKQAQKIKKLEQSLKSTNSLYEKEQKISIKYSEDLEQSKKRQTILQEKIKQQEQAMTNMKIKIEQLILESKKKSRSQTREVKRQPKKVMMEVETQTEIVESQEQIKQVKEEQKIQRVEQEVQTEADQYLQLAQEKSQEVMVPVYSQKKQEVLQKKEDPPKKVENKDFRKALKLTYMRR